jgi:hypothetical protein
MALDVVVTGAWTMTDWMNMAGWGLVDVCEVVGSALSIAGAYLLAFQCKWSRYGWALFFGANLANIVFALLLGRYPFLVSQVVFVGSSLLGMYRSGLLGGRRSTAATSG